MHDETLDLYNMKENCKKKKAANIKQRRPETAGLSLYEAATGGCLKFFWPPTRHMGSGS